MTDLLPGQTLVERRVVGSSAQLHAAQPRWLIRYGRLVLGIDVLALVVASGLAQELRFGSRWDGALRGVSYLLISAILIALWVGVLALSRAHEHRFLGAGSEEFKRVANASVRVVAIVAVFCYLLRIELSRLVFASTLAFGTVLLFGGRYAARRVLHRMRYNGRCTHKVIIVGARERAEHIVSQARLQPHSGFLFVGACIPAGDRDSADIDGLPILGDVEDVVSAVRSLGADSVTVTSFPGMTSEWLRRLSWSLEGTGVDLMVSPALTDVAGPRIHIRPVAGLPLLHIEEPELGGGRQLIKSIGERTLAAGALVVLSPFFLLIAIAIMVGDGGAPLFRQTRVGRHGETFRILKFRTMRPDAEEILPSLQEHNEHDGVLFKMRADPRVTRVGRFLRRWSIDEFPQLLNVVTGSMSLVGPRPPLPCEVERYHSDVHRRLLVRPGLTGLWQISGRSGLSWEESVRLDLYYVENWSIMLDLTILWKTAFAVLRRQGAY